MLILVKILPDFQYQKIEKKGKKKKKEPWDLYRDTSDGASTFIVQTQIFFI
jgi:hypothetical protein